MTLKLTSNSTGKGPNLKGLFYKPGTVFHLSKKGKNIRLLRVLKGRATHILTSWYEQKDSISIDPINNTTSCIWELDMDRDEFIKFISNFTDVYCNELPAYGMLFSKITLKGEPMSKDSILNIIK